MNSPFVTKELEAKELEAKELEAKELEAKELEANDSNTFCLNNAAVPEVSSPASSFGLPPQIDGKRLSAL